MFAPGTPDEFKKIEEFILGLPKKHDSTYPPLAVAVTPARLAVLEKDEARVNHMETLEGAALLSDDAGHWAVSGTGVQNVPDDPPQDISTSFFVSRDEWSKSVREALDRSIARAHPSTSISNP